MLVVGYLDNNIELVTWPQAADKEVGASGTIRSKGDIFLNGAQEGLMTGYIYLTFYTFGD